MSSVQVLSGEQSEEFQRWERQYLGFPNTDVYFSPQYAQIYDKKGDGFARCFVYRSDDGVVLYPFLLRRINDLELFRDIRECWDIITPYGYGGPLYQPADESSLLHLSKDFLSSFHAYCQENNIVSELARLHPLLENHRFLPDEREVFHHETVYMDLRQSELELWKDVRKGHKSSIKKAIRLGVKIFQDKSLQYLNNFHKLYIDTMERQEASLKYFLPMEFFQNTFELLGEHASLFVALHDGKVVTAAIFMHYGDYVHYHFSGSDTSFLQFCGNHLLIHEVAKWAQERGAKYFHLGGGLETNDGLFTFKSGFSTKRASFYTYRAIHDSALYQELVNRKVEDERLNGSVVDEQFFPRYRA